MFTQGPPCMWLLKNVIPEQIAANGIVPQISADFNHFLTQTDHLWTNRAWLRQSFDFIITKYNCFVFRSLFNLSVDACSFFPWCTWSSTLWCWRFSFFVLWVVSLRDLFFCLCSSGNLPAADWRGRSKQTGSIWTLFTVKKGPCQTFQNETVHDHAHVWLALGRSSDPTKY